MHAFETFLATKTLGVLLSGGDQEIRRGFVLSFWFHVGISGRPTAYPVLSYTPSDICSYEDEQIRTDVAS